MWVDNSQGEPRGWRGPECGRERLKLSGEGRNSSSPCRAHDPLSVLSWLLSGRGLNKGTAEGHFLL